jgi:tetratricopeptide (TPR) repeat protein
MLNNMGVVYRVEGNLAEAANKLEKARKTFAEAKDRSREAQTLGNLAPLYSKQGATAKALETYDQAEALFQEISDADRQGEILMAKGLLQFRLGQRSIGLGAYEAGLLLMKSPTGQQKRLRTMLKLRQKLLGG